jgi:type IV secretion system protein VirB4
VKAESKFEALARQEVPAADFVPYTSHVSPEVIRTRDGEYVRTWRLDGITFEACDPVDILLAHNSFNEFVRALPGGQCHLWTHRIRRRVSDRLSTDYENDFCRDLAHRYYDSFNGYRMMSNELYLSLVWQSPGARPGLLSALAGATPTLKERLDEEAQAVKRMAEFAHSVRAALKRYGPTPLTCVDADGKPVDAVLLRNPDEPIFSELLQVFGYLTNGIWTKYAVGSVPLREVLPITKLLFSGDKLEIRGLTSTRYAALLDVKDYPDVSEPGMLDPLLYEGAEYIETQSFSVMTRNDAQAALRRQERQLIASGDVAASQIAAMPIAKDRLANGDFVMGEYHYSLAVLADSPQALDQHVANLGELLKEASLQAVLIDLVADAAWFAQLPANRRLRARTATLTSRNFCGLASLHNFATGKRDGNPWGEAVAILKTPSGQPFFFNFHATRDDEDSTDKKTPASTTIIGATGQGKTAFEAAMLAFSQKYGVTSVVLDRDRGMDIFVRALGGTYRHFEQGKPTGMNPFQLEPTEANILYWERFVRQLLGTSGALTDADERSISAAVRTIAGFSDPRLRRLSGLRQNLGNDALAKRLSKWCAGDRFGWVFDNPVDEIRFDQGRLFGFDDSELIKDPELAGPVTSYLLQATDRLMDGRRFSYVVAEAWERLGDPLFRQFATEKQKTGRKANAFGIFDTQSPSDMLQVPNSKTMVEQSATLVFLANPKADRDDYVGGYKTTDAEFEIIKSLPDGGRMMLVKQGHRSAVVSFDLSGMDDVLDIVSSTEDNVRLLDEIRAEVGDDPAAWRPVLAARTAHRRAHMAARRGA